jgi:hypothetical protein
MITPENIDGWALRRALKKRVDSEARVEDKGKLQRATIKVCGLVYSHCTEFKVSAESLKASLHRCICEELGYPDPGPLADCDPEVLIRRILLHNGKL